MDYAKRGDTENAIKGFNLVIEAKPDDAEAWYNLGVQYRKAGSTNEAAAAFQRARELNPELFK